MKKEYGIKNKSKTHTGGTDTQSEATLAQQTDPTSHPDPISHKSGGNSNAEKEPSANTISSSSSAIMNDENDNVLHGPTETGDDNTRTGKIKSKCHFLLFFEVYLFIFYITIP